MRTVLTLALVFAIVGGAAAQEPSGPTCEQSLAATRELVSLLDTWRRGAEEDMAWRLQRLRAEHQADRQRLLQEISRLQAELAKARKGMEAPTP